MKVKCISAGAWQVYGVFTRKHWWSKKTPKPAKGPKKDDIVSVEDEHWHEGEKYYRLVEWPTPPGTGYDAACFKPIDEEQAQFEEVTFSEIQKEVPASAN